MYDIAFGIIIGLIFISLIILFCVLLVKLYINKIKSHTQQLYQKDVEFQKSLNETILETQEQVLTNISQDLHDDAGQQLTYLNFQLENLKLDSPELQTLLEPISQSVTHLSGSIRGLSHALNNHSLMQQDLLKAIQTEVERIQKNAKCSISLEIQDTFQKQFTSHEKIVIYRIFQELLNNVFKHAKATKISIIITTSPKFKMIFQDNGKGFNTSQVLETPKTIGLFTMHKRAAVIAYQLEVQSEIGVGTTITLSEN